MNKILITIIIGLLLIGCVSAYYCIYSEDNEEVQKFKYNLNVLSYEEDIKNGLTDETIRLKLKYFGPCSK